MKATQVNAADQQALVWRTETRYTREGLVDTEEYLGRMSWPEFYTLAEEAGEWGGTATRFCARPA